jgi:quinoprotein glucose dehydrogenase
LIVGGQVRAQPYLTVDSTVESGEGGLMGLALHPRFPDQAFVYATQTFQNASGNLENRVIRLRHLGDRAEFDRVILDGIPGGRNHNGGRIAFGPDGMLYIGAGETFQGELAQDMKSLGGKILRVTPDDGIPADNPFSNSPIYTLGNRNPQGFAWQPQTGVMFSSEHGPSGENGWRGHDELNLILRGDNYGWPRVIGAPGRTGFDDPIVFWADGAPPGNMAFWRGDLYIATLRRQALVRVSLERVDQTFRATRLENWFASSNGQGRYGRLRDAVVGPDGALYVTTSNQDGRASPRDGDDRILRIAPRN